MEQARSRRAGTHTYPHTHVHARTRTHAHTHTPLHTHTRTRTRTHVHTGARTQKERKQTMIPLFRVNSTPSSMSTCRVRLCHVSTVQRHKAQHRCDTRQPFANPSHDSLHQVTQHEHIHVAYRVLAVLLHALSFLNAAHCPVYLHGSGQSRGPEKLTLLRTSSMFCCCLDQQLLAMVVEPTWRAMLLAASNAWESGNEPTTCHASLALQGDGPARNSSRTTMPCSCA